LIDHPLITDDDNTQLKDTFNVVGHPRAYSRNCVK
jgi:hypothetical protein